DTKQRIEQLCEYFRDQVKAIVDLKLPSQPGELTRYQKTLLVTVLDGLAAIRFHRNFYPQLATRNRERFTRFVSGHCDWSGAALVSIPFLATRLERGKMKGGLFDRVHERLTGFSPQGGNSIPLEKIDLPLEELAQLVTSEEEERELHEVQHVALL